jgi:hypothetical protein
LSGQIHRVLNFHRIDRGIVLPNEFLAQCGLALGNFASSPAVVPQQQSVVTLPSVTQKVNLPAPEPVKHSPASTLVAEEEDDSDEVEQVKVPIKIGGLNASQSVADFLNGTNGR